jgi:hypothetical protein
MLKCVNNVTLLKNYVTHISRLRLIFVPGNKENKL